MTAVLQAIPSGPDIPLEAARPHVQRCAGGAVGFVLATCGRRWVVFDVSGRTRLRARPVRGGLATVEDGSLLSVAGERFRLVSDREPAVVVPGAGALCAYCREPIGGDESCLQCPICGRVHHEDCLAMSSSCGRCRHPLRGERR